MRWQGQDVPKQEQQTRVLIQAAGRARRRGVRSTLHWVASLTQQHATDQQHGITNKRQVSKKNATE
jgi:hypothetical protein